MERFQQGDRVMVKKGVWKQIQRGEVSPRYNYINPYMSLLAEEEKVLIIRKLIVDKNDIGYKVDGCIKHFTYNEEWLMPAVRTNEDATYLLRESL